MSKLLDTLQAMIEKYNIAEEDIAIIQEALSELENGANDEFEYLKETEDVEPE